jgi:hypothetical protein
MFSDHFKIHLFYFIYMQQSIIINYHLGAPLPFLEHNFFSSEVFFASQTFLPTRLRLFVVGPRL